MLDGIPSSSENPPIKDECQQAISGVYQLQRGRNQRRSHDRPRRSEPCQFLPVRQRGYNARITHSTSEDTTRKTTSPGQHIQLNEHTREKRRKKELYPYHHGGSIPPIRYLQFSPFGCISQRPRGFFRAIRQNAKRTYVYFETLLPIFTIYQEITFVFDTSYTLVKTTSETT